jgi:methylase of polypeptide subunit release factors
MTPLTHIELAHLFWEKHLKPTSKAVDATLGNGKDILRLADLLPQGHVYGVDIQKEALQNSEKSIRSHNRELSNISLIHASHVSFSFLQEPADLIVYNLGYLPGSDKKIITMPATTVQSLQAAISHLSKKGALSITSYLGHAGGLEEHEAVMHFLHSLDPQHWDLVQYKWPLRNHYPIFYWLQKRK